MQLSIQEVQKTKNDHAYIIISTYEGRPKIEAGLERMNDETRQVHVSGHLFLWVLKEILGKAPNLESIRVIPSTLAMLSSSHRNLCHARGVQLLAGHDMPQFIRPKEAIRNPAYLLQQSFMLNLTGEQKESFEELRMFGFEAAQIAARYFCLSGEPYISHSETAIAFGYGAGSHHFISQSVLSVLYYLDTSFDVGEGSRKRAASMHAKVSRLRRQFSSSAALADLRNHLLRTYDFRLTNGFPLSRIDTLEKVLAAERSGGIERLHMRSALDSKVIVLRFGLDLKERGAYRKLEDIGKLLNNVTRERIRQREERALKFLGIKQNAA